MMDSGSNVVQVAATEVRVDEMAERGQGVAICLWKLFCVENLWAVIVSYSLTLSDNSQGVAFYYYY